MNVIKQAGWWTYAVLATIFTLGVFPRFHLITVRKRTMGGVRAGNFGCTHVYLDTVPAGNGSLGGKLLVISRMLSKQYFPLEKIAYVNKHLIAVTVESSGGKLATIATVSAAKLQAFITWARRAAG